MSYYSNKKEVKETTQNKTVAVATHEAGAEVIVKALNHFFGDTYTTNQAVEMMNQNTSNALKSIAGLAEKQDMDRDELIAYLLEVSEEMEAQAIVVSMRDELKFDKPNES